MKPQVVFYYLFKLVVLIALWVVGIYVWNYGFDFSAVTTSASSAAQSVTAPPTDPGSQSSETGQTGNETDGGNTESNGQIDAQQVAALAAVSPTINLPADTVEAGTVALSGSGQQGTQIEVVVNGSVVGTAMVGEDGQWRIDASLAEPGDYQLAARALDSTGTVLAESVPVTLRVDAPAQKIMPTINLPGNSVEAGQVLLSGTGQPGSQIEIVVNGQVVDTTAVGNDGGWTYSADFPEPGDYQLTVSALDENGAVLAGSEPILMQVNSGAITTNIVPPVLNLPTGDLQAGEGELSGTGQPGSQIEIVVNGQVVDTITVGEDGRWVYSTGFAEAGDYQLALRVLGQDGSVLAETEPVEVKIRPRRPVAPTINQPDGTPETGVVVLTGSGEPAGKIELLVDNEVIGTTTTGSNGVWRLRPVLTEPGDYELIARSVSDDGEELVTSEPLRLAIIAPQPTPVPTSPPADATPEPGSDQEYVVQGDDWLSKIADKFYGNPQAYPVIFDGTNEKAAEDDSFEAIEDPNLIYVGQKLWIPAVNTISTP